MDTLNQTTAAAEKRRGRRKHMAVGLIVLSIVSVLVVFGAAQRVLDRMQLSDRAALAIAALIFFGVFVPDIRFGRVFGKNDPESQYYILRCAHFRRNRARMRGRGAETSAFSPKTCAENVAPGSFAIIQQGPGNGREREGPSTEPPLQYQGRKGPWRLALNQQILKEL